MQLLSFQISAITHCQFSISTELRSQASQKEHMAEGSWSSVGFSKPIHHPQEHRMGQSAVGCPEQIAWISKRLSYNWCLACVESLRGLVLPLMLGIWRRHTAICRVLTALCRELKTFPKSKRFLKITHFNEPSVLGKCSLLPKAEWEVKALLKRQQDLNIGLFVCVHMFFDYNWMLKKLAHHHVIV